jgi:hypothetical protein
MSHQQRILEFEERIRDLCARVVRAEGVDFEISILELANAMALLESAREDEGRHRTAQAS